MQIKVGKKSAYNAKRGWASYPVRTLANGITKLGHEKGFVKFFHTKREAEAYAEKLNCSQRDGGVVGVVGVEKTMGAAISEFIASTNARCDKGVITSKYANNLITNANSWRSLGAISMGKMVAFENLKCSEVNVLLIETYLIDQFEKVAWKTKKEKLNALKLVFDLAHRLGWVGSTNPAQLVKLEEVKYSGERAAENIKLKRFDLNEIRSLIIASQTFPKADGIAVRFAAETGLRFGEQAALRWHHLDFKAGVVKVRLALRKNKYGVIAGDIPKTTKNGRDSKSVRNVPIPSDLLQLLKEWRVKSKFSTDMDYIFCTSIGTHQTSSDNWRKRVLHASCEAVGIDRIRWHDLRHFYASISLSVHKNDLVRVADLMGHESVETTRSIYGHWIEDKQRDKNDAEKINNALWGV